MNNDLIITQMIKTFDKSKLKAGMPVYVRNFIGGIETHNALITAVTENEVSYMRIHESGASEKFSFKPTDVENGNVEIYPLEVVKEQTANESNIVNHLRAIKNYCRNHNCDGCRFEGATCRLRATTPAGWGV